MAIREREDCKICGRINVEVFDETDKCIICTRLDGMEKEIEKLKKETRYLYGRVG